MAKKQQALAVYDEELAALAKSATAAVSTLGSSGNYISTKSGVFSYQGAALASPFRAIVLAFLIENAHRVGKYDPDNPQQPDCFAFGEDARTMAPHPESSHPYSDACATCEFHQFGSAETGKGMACQVGRQRLALLAEDAMDNIEGAAIAVLNLPYFSSKEWSGYVKQVSKALDRPPMGVFTEISIKPDAKSQFLIQFGNPTPIDFKGEPKAYPALKAKRDMALQILGEPYQAIVEEEKPKAPARRVVAPPARRPVAVRR